MGLINPSRALGLLFQWLWKTVNNSKSYVPTVPMIIPIKVLKYFSSGKINFILAVREISTRATVLLIEKGLEKVGKCGLLARVCLPWKLKKYTNDYKAYTSTIFTS